jgi:hypothetical protein
MERLFNFNADGKVMVAMVTFPEHLLEFCDVVLRLLAASTVHTVTLFEGTYRGVGSISAPALASLMEHCQSLKCLSLMRLALDEIHCRALGTYSRPDLEIELTNCRLTDAAAVVLAEDLGLDQGPTRLDYCDGDYSILANGMRRNRLFRGH